MRVLLCGFWAACGSVRRCAGLRVSSIQFVGAGICRRMRAVCTGDAVASRVPRSAAAGLCPPAIEWSAAMNSPARPLRPIHYLWGAASARAAAATPLPSPHHAHYYTTSCHLMVAPHTHFLFHGLIVAVLALCGERGSRKALRVAASHIGTAPAPPLSDSLHAAAAPPGAVALHRPPWLPLQHRPQQHGSVPLRHAPRFVVGGGAPVCSKGEPFSCPLTLLAPSMLPRHGAPGISHLPTPNPHPSHPFSLSRSIHSTLG